MAFCTGCGSQVDEGTKFCQKCGQPMTSAAPVAYAAQPGTTPPGTIYAGTPSTAPGYVAAPTSQYAGFWIRFVAYVIDALIVGIPLTIIVLICVFAFGAFGGLAALHNIPNNPDPEQVQTQLIPMITALIGAYALFFLGAIIICWLYFALMESSERQATFGKAALNLRVSDANGNRLSFGHASGRYFAKIVTNLVPLAIGWIMAGFTAKKQALHDFIAGTIVTRTI